MAEYSLYFGTHSAHKANAWILGLWLNHEFCLFKTKGLRFILFLFYYSKWNSQNQSWNYESLVKGFEQQPWLREELPKTKQTKRKPGLLLLSHTGSGGTVATTRKSPKKLHNCKCWHSIKWYELVQSLCTSTSVGGRTWCFTINCSECARSVSEWDRRGQHRHSVTFNVLSIQDNS